MTPPTGRQVAAATLFGLAVVAAAWLAWAAMAHGGGPR